MKLTLKQYEFIKKEISEKEVTLPSKPEYYFQTYMRRSIRVVPKFRRGVEIIWNKRELNKKEEIYMLEFTCVYLSFQCKVEKFTISTTDIEKIYYDENNKHYELIKSYLDGVLIPRSKEQFEADLEEAIQNFNGE